MQRCSWPAPAGRLRCLQQLGDLVPGSHGLGHAAEAGVAQHQALPIAAGLRTTIFYVP
jgi:hypothetical protein